MTDCTSFWLTFTPWRVRAALAKAMEKSPATVCEKRAAPP